MSNSARDQIIETAKALRYSQTNDPLVYPLVQSAGSIRWFDPLVR